MDGDRQKHLEMIQHVIERMARCSFLLKGWSVTLVAGLFALAATGSKTSYIYLAYFPAVAFWGLDAYYLWQERLFRALYDQVRLLDDGAIGFSMKPPSSQSLQLTWVGALFSGTVVIFYGAILVAILVVLVVAT